MKMAVRRRLRNHSLYSQVICGIAEIYKKNHNNVGMVMLSIVVGKHNVPFILLGGG